MVNIAVIIVWLIIFLWERTNPGSFNQSILLVAIPMVVLFLTKKEKDGLLFIQYLLTVGYFILVILIKDYEPTKMEVVIYPIFSALIIINLTPIIKRIENKSKNGDDEE